MIEPSASDDAAIFERAQAFMAECGVAPYPTQVLSGGLGPAAFAVLSKPEDGSIVAVRKDMRGRGLGAFVNALVLKKAVEEMGAERVQEFARTSNIASCRMIEHCGLSLRSDVRSGIAQPAEAASFTR